MLYFKFLCKGYPPSRSGSDFLEFTTETNSSVEIKNLIGFPSCLCLINLSVWLNRFLFQLGLGFSLVKIALMTQKTIHQIKYIKKKEVSIDYISDGQLDGVMSDLVQRFPNAGNVNLASYILELKSTSNCLIELTYSQV